MARTHALKKGAPPKRGEVADVIAADPRAEETAKTPLQLKLAPSMVREFKREANERFDHRPGALSKMFEEMWALYQSQK